MLINIFDNWINPQNILGVINTNDVEGHRVSKIIFSGYNEAEFNIEFRDKTIAEVAAEINTAVAAARKASSEARGERREGGGSRGGYKSGGDRGGYKGGGDRGGYKGGGKGGFKDRGDRGDRGDRERKPERGGEEHKGQVREGFAKKKFEGGKKYESRDRGDFKPKKRKDW